MGIVPMPGLRAYWEAEFFYGPIADVISRTQFQLLLSVIHFADNMSVSKETRMADKLWKTRPWLDLLQSNCQRMIDVRKDQIAHWPMICAKRG